MPNWCNNQVSISGPNKVLKKFMKVVNDPKGKKGLFEMMRPMPKELRNTTADGSERKDMIKKYGCSDWYGWANSKWGTKWDANEFYGIEHRVDKVNPKFGTLEFGFDTAWAPPMEVFEHFFNQDKYYDDCSFKLWYYEPGCDFAGCWDGSDDDCIQISQVAKAGSKDKFWKTSFGSELDYRFGIVENMAQYEEDMMEDVHKYAKGEAVNVGEEI